MALALVLAAIAGTGQAQWVSSMIGWGSGADWDKTFAFFARGNEWSYEEFAKCAAESK